MKPIGEKIGDFLLQCTNEPKSNEAVNDLIIAFVDIENHLPLQACGEAPEVIQELQRECRRKVVPLIRSVFVESIRNTIANCRKKLSVKAALDGNASSQHSQRHLNLLIELIGSWSNVTSMLSHYCLSRETSKMILLQLYERLMEAVVECFVTFKKDKEIDQWTRKALDPTIEINLNALDSVVTQVSTMKEIISKHYEFLANTFANMPSIENEAQQQLGPQPTYIPRYVLATEAELNQWRELDALYMALEFGYLSRAIQEAYGELQLIEIEDHAYIPQLYEDFFFLLNRVTERAISTGSESNLFSMGNKVIEYIRPSQFEDALNHQSILFALCSCKATYQYCMVNRALPEKVLRLLLKAEEATDGGDYSNDLFLSTPGKPQDVMQLKDDADQEAEEKGQRYLPLGIAANALSHVANKSLAGVNTWLVGLASPYIEGGPESGQPSEAAMMPPPKPVRNVSESAGIAVTEKHFANGAGSGSNSAPSSQSNKLPYQTPGKSKASKVTPPTSLRKGDGSVTSLQELLYTALESDATTRRTEPLLFRHKPYCAESYQHILLKEEEWLVMLNALSMIVSSIRRLKALYEAAQRRIIAAAEFLEGEESNGHSESSRREGSSLYLVLSEFAICENLYDGALRSNMGLYAHNVYQEFMGEEVRRFCSRSFDISGEEMEHAYNENNLLTTCRNCFDWTVVKMDAEREGESSDSSHRLCVRYLQDCEGHVSMQTLSYLLSEVSRMLSSDLLSMVHQKIFTEWGALLLDQEVLAVVRFFDGLVESLENILPVKSAFETLQFTLKILILDAPGDIRRYSIPSQLFSSIDAVRSILSRRKEFSKEAILGVKVNLVQ